MKTMILLSLLLGHLAFGANPSFVSPEESKAKFVSFAQQIDTAPIAALPLLHNGRIKPLDSLARESLIYISGKYSMWGLSALQTYLAMMVSDAATYTPIIEIRGPELRKELGLPSDRRHYSAVELQTLDIETLARPLAAKQEQNKSSLTERENKILEVWHQLMLFRAIVSGNQFVATLNIGAGAEVLHAGAERYLRALATSDSNLAKAEASELVRQSNAISLPPILAPYRDNAPLEVTYNRIQPFFIAALVYFFAGLLVLIPQARSRLGTKGILALIGVPMFLHGAGFATRVYITRFAPVTNMYGTMLWVSFGVAFFCAILYGFYRQAKVVGLLLISSSALLLFTQSMPLTLSPDMDPIVAVLRSNFWLTTHVLTITISYAAFTIAMILGNTGLIANLIGIKDREFYKRYAHLAYRMIQLGVFLISGGIILGGIWADYSWGRFWGWDPKETWALIADLGFIMILHARYNGWLKDFGLLAMSAAAYQLVIMAWYGVNFVLAAGLHSYGFSSGGALIVGIFVALQLTLLAASLFKWVTTSRK